MFGAACNGAPNPALMDKFTMASETDPATLNQNASCSAAYKNQSFLCGACADGFSLSGLCVLMLFVLYSSFLVCRLIFFPLTFVL